MRLHTTGPRRARLRIAAVLGMLGFAKTTGSKGIHVYVRVEPGWDSFAVRGAVVALGRELARRAPGLITDAWWKEERGARVFIDFNQNAPHKTVFGAWSARPRAVSYRCRLPWSGIAFLWNSGRSRCRACHPAMFCGRLGTNAIRETDYFYR